MNSQNAKKASSSTEDRASGPEHLSKGRVEELLRAGAARLRGAGVDAPRLCAEMLMAHLLVTDRAALCRASKEKLSMDQAARYEASAGAARRARAGPAHRRPHGILVAEHPVRSERADPAAGDGSRRRDGARHPQEQRGPGHRRYRHRHRLHRDRPGDGTARRAPLRFRLLARAPSSSPRGTWRRTA